MSNILPSSIGVGAISATLNPYVACTTVIIMGIIVIKAMNCDYKVSVRHGDTSVVFEPAGRNEE